ncbi:MAG: hypothetical protein HHAS10_09950 [Candidatus Altimarinota bacterium]
MSFSLERENAFKRSYTYILFLQVKMRSPNENIYLILFSTFVEGVKKTFENITQLVSSGNGDRSGIIYSIFHYIFVDGPKKFRKNPTAVSIGRGIFSPFIFVFKKSQGNSK